MSNIFVFPTYKNYDKSNWNEETRNTLIEFIETEDFINKIKESKKEKIFIKGNWYTIYYTDSDDNVIKINEKLVGD